jgi:hypothetical protein
MRQLTQLGLLGIKYSGPSSVNARILLTTKCFWVALDVQHHKEKHTAFNVLTTLSDGKLYIL